MEIVRSAVGTPESANLVTSSAWHGHVYFSMPNQWTTMQWTTWFLYLGCRPSAGATATSPQCVMRAPRPGPVVFPTVRLYESSVVSLGRSLMSWRSSGSEYLVENEARREAWRSSSNTTADWPW